MSIRGVITKHESGTLVFCPDLQVDFRLGKPNDSWIQENGCYITNAESYPELKEGSDVLVECQYPTHAPGEVMNPLRLWCNCKIIKLNSE